MDAESTQFESLDDFFTSVMHRDPNFYNEYLDDYFNVMKQKDRNSFALELARFVSNLSKGSFKRSICSYFLQKLLTEDRDLSTWRNLPVSTQSAIKTTFLDCLMQSRSRTIVANAGVTVMKLGPSLITGDNNSWPELLPSLYQIVTSSTCHRNGKMSAFRIFGLLANEIGETVLSSVNNSLHRVFRITLNDDALDLELRVTAMCSAIDFILCVSSSNERQRFQDLLPGIMKALTEALTSTSEELGFEKEIPLRQLTSLAKNDPRFLRIQLVDVVSTVLEILETEWLEDEVRLQGVEFLLTLVEAREKAPGMMRKLPLFVGRCFAMLLKFLLLGIMDDPAWHSAETLHDQAGTASTFHVCGMNLERFSLALGGKAVGHEAIEQVSAYLDALEWEKRHAGLFALFYIAEGCSKVMIKNLEQVIDMVLNCFQDPHPRVRWAARLVIGSLLQIFKAYVQEEHHDQVYLALFEVLDDFHPRAQDEKQIVQQESLGTLASIARFVKDHFQTYYDTVMPRLKGVLGNADLKSDLSLRTRVIVCISAIGLAVGKEKFREDGKQIIKVLTPVQDLQDRADDPNTWDMLMAYTTICECIGQELLPWMNTVIPLLIQCAKWHDENYESDDKIHCDNCMRPAKVIFRDKTLSMDGGFHEEKARACNLLYWYARILEEDFCPWIPQVVSVLFPLLKFRDNNHVRKYAVEGMRIMLHYAKVAAEKGIDQAGSESYFTELSNYVILSLVDALHKEKVGDLCIILLQELHQCLQICRLLLHEDLVRSIVDEIKHVITHSSRRKQELKEREKFEDFDDEEAELLRDERGLEESIFVPVCNILRTLIIAFKAAFLSYLDELLSYLLPMLVKEQTTNLERSSSIRIFTSLVEECPEAAVKYYDVCFPLILDLSNDEDPDVRQNALYGLRLWAEYGRSSFKDFVGVALPKINEVIMHLKAREPENENAYDNAVSALGYSSLVELPAYKS